MEAIKKKELRLTFQNALTNIALDLDLPESKKVRAIIKDAAKKLGTQLKIELKKQEALKRKAAKKTKVVKSSKKVNGKKIKKVRAV